MNNKVLIIDDDRPIQKLLEIATKTLGLIPLTAYTMEEGYHCFVTENPILILLDLGLPDGNGISFLETVREWSRVPIIIISARHNENEKIEAFDKGADDYVTKPFSTGELLARIKAVLRRLEGQEITRTSYTSNNISLDVVSHLVTLEGVELKCTPKEFELLKHFLAAQNKVLTHTFLLQNIWGSGYENEVHYLRVLVNGLRQKIEPNPSFPSRIITETGIGYRFIG